MDVDPLLEELFEETEGSLVETKDVEDHISEGHVYMQPAPKQQPGPRSRQNAKVAYRPYDDDLEFLQRGATDEERRKNCDLLEEKKRNVQDAIDNPETLPERIGLARKRIKLLNKQIEKEKMMHTTGDGPGGHHRTQRCYRPQHAAAESAAAKAAAATVLGWYEQGQQQHRQKQLRYQKLREAAARAGAAMQRERTETIRNAVLNVASSTRSSCQVGKKHPN